MLVKVVSEIIVIKAQPAQSDNPFNGRERSPSVAKAYSSLTKSGWTLTVSFKKDDGLKSTPK